MMLQKLLKHKTFEHSQNFYFSVSIFEFLLTRILVKCVFCLTRARVGLGVFFEKQRMLVINIFISPLFYC